MNTDTINAANAIIKRLLPDSWEKSMDFSLVFPLKGTPTLFVEFLLDADDMGEVEAVLKEYEVRCGDAEGCEPPCLGPR